MCFHICVPAHQVPSEKWSVLKGKNLRSKGVCFKKKAFDPKMVYSKRKEFAPMGANSFLLEQTSFQKGG